MSGPAGGYRSNYDAVVERSETLRRENQALRAELAQLRSVLDPRGDASGGIPRAVFYALAYRTEGTRPELDGAPA